MAHLWLNDGGAGCLADGGWSPVPLDAEALLLRDGGVGPSPAPAAAAGAVLRRAVTPDGECWVVTAGAAVRVNGRSLATGIAVLCDRDELLVAGRRAYFSTEVLVAVEAAPAADRSLVCPRCKLPIAPGTPSVVCPRCKVRHHQDPSTELPCWLYAASCAVCDQPSALDSGYRWMPGDI
jgi:hypothetical protein